MCIRDSGRLVFHRAIVSEVPNMNTNAILTPHHGHREWEIPAPVMRPIFAIPMNTNMAWLTHDAMFNEWLPALPPILVNKPLNPHFPVLEGPISEPPTHDTGISREEILLPNRLQTGFRNHRKFDCRMPGPASIIRWFYKNFLSGDFLTAYQIH